MKVLLFLLALQLDLGWVDAFGLGVNKKIQTKGCQSSTVLCNSPETSGSSVAKSNRRDFIGTASGTALSLLLLSNINSQPALAQDGIIKASQRLFVITGANSGIGFEACKRLANSPENTVVMACRNMEKAQSAAGKLQDLPGTLIPAECDLSNLQSISQFAQGFTNLVGDRSVDTLCLNAGYAPGISQKEATRTADGFELTVGTNHFGHFYLNHLMLPKLNKQSGHIVVTASGVHDPDSPGGAQGSSATLGDLKGLEQQGKQCAMLDGGKFDPDKAYKDSKLCNVLFTRELQKRLDSNPATSNIAVNCYNPGLTVGTGLFRNQNQIFTKVFNFAATDLLKVGEVPSWGGGCLEYVTSVDTKGQYYSSEPGSSKYGDAGYGKQFNVAEVSKEARDDAKAKKLWSLTERELGISF